MRDPLVATLAAVLAALSLLAGGVAAEAPAQSTGGLSTVTIDGRANIFGAGRSTLPAPAGGGAGTAPVAYSLPAGAAQVTFAGGTGSVTCCTGFSSPPYNGPAGGVPIAPGGTDIEPVGSISGVSVADRQMFLVGVFLGSGAPTGSPPASNTLTRSPALRQVFYVGAGPRTVDVPAGGTRLFLGFADAFGFQGQAGYYDDNAGSVQIALSISTTTPPPAQSPTRYTWSLDYDQRVIWRDSDDDLFLALEVARGGGAFSVSQSRVTAASGRLRFSGLVTPNKWARTGRSQSFGLTVVPRGAVFHTSGASATLTLPVTVTPTALRDADINCLADPDGTLIRRDRGPSASDSITLVGVCGIKRGTAWSHVRVDIVRR